MPSFDGLNAVHLPYLDRLLLRDASSASLRPISRVSHRPVSRLSYRPSTRQSSRVAQLCQSLVTQVTGLHENDEKFNEALDLVTKKVDSVIKQASGFDMREAEWHLQRCGSTTTKFTN